VQTEALSGATTYTLTLINNTILASSLVYVTCFSAVGTTGMYLISEVATGGAVTMNFAFTASYTGAAQIIFFVVN
jgi:hypothetical protein